MTSPDSNNSLPNGSIFARTRVQQGLALATAALLALGVIHAGWSTLSVLMIAVVTAYLLKPLHRRLTAQGIPSSAAAAIAIFLLILLLILLTALYMPPLIASLSRIIDVFSQAPDIIEPMLTRISSWLEGARYLPYFHDGVATSVQDLAPYLEWLPAQMAKIGNNAARFFVSLVGNWAENSLNILLLPLVLYYLLRDSPKDLGFRSTILPPFFRGWALSVWRDVMAALERFLYGQVLVLACLAVLYTLALLVIQHPYALAMGVLTGMLSIIPMAGTVASLLIALLTLLPGDPGLWHVVSVLCVYAALNLLENLFLVPTLLGKSLNIHPLWVLFALLASGSALGIWGIVLALPMLCAARVVFCRLIDVYSPDNKA